MPDVGSPALEGARNPFDAIAGVASTNPLLYLSTLATGGDGTVGNPWTGWETAFNALAANVRIDLLAGYYSQTLALLTKRGQSLKGSGMDATFITSAFTGSAIKSLFTINTNNAAYLKITDLALVNTHVANTGSGILQVAGTYVYIENVKVVGFRYQLTLNQSELAHIRGCDFETGTTVPRAGIWIVNGADYNLTYADTDYSTGTTGLSNVITVANCQFNSQTIPIIDDGGFNHIFRNNNYNGGINYIRLAGTLNVTISGSDMEPVAATQDAIILANTTYNSGTGVGQSTNTILEQNGITPHIGFSTIVAASGAHLTLINNRFNSALPIVSGTVNIAGIYALGNSNALAGALLDAISAFSFELTSTEINFARLALRQNALNGFMITLFMNGATLQHQITSGDDAGSAANLVAQVNGFSAALQSTPFVTNVVAMVAGVGVENADKSVIHLDTPAQTAGSILGNATVIPINGAPALAAQWSSKSININGVTRLRSVIKLFNAGVAYDLSTLPASAVLRIQVAPWIHE